ncbi:transducin family protein [Populus alba x Populus x berolinensis]|nr:transducin family protein [Populus alba x Populus x berolinensis]
MNNRRRHGGEIYQHQEVQRTTRSRSRKPPHHGSWQPTVPSWEKRFCYSVGSIPWRKLLETKKLMYLYENVVKWNDSAGEEAFHNAKNRFWAEINGLPCNISLPDPDIYIDEIDWNSSVDPELLLDLEREPKDHDEITKGEEVVIIGSSLLLNQSFSCAGWGGAEEEFQKVPDSALDPGHWDFNHKVTSDENPWGRNVTHPNEAMNNDGWDCWNDSFGWGNNEWDVNNDGKNADDGTGGDWGTLDGYNQRREGTGWQMSSYKTSRFHGDEYPMDRGLWRHGRGRRRVVMAAEEENPALSNLPEESSAVVPDDELMIDSSSPIQPTPPIIPPVIPSSIPVLPSIAPIPIVPPRPLAPLPIRPPATRPPGVQNGEMRTSDSDSDQEELSPTGTTPGSTGGYEISEASRLVRERQQKAMQEFMMKKRAAALAVPTNDMAVRTRLRRLGEPITLFGEREMERRDRLRMLMAKLDSEGQLEKLMKVHEEEEAASTAAAEDAEEEFVQYPFYTEGSKELLDARIDIAKYSISKAALRLQRARRKRDDPDEDEDAEIDWTLNQAESLSLNCSELGDDRPLSGCSFSSDGEMLATCSLSGVAKIWSVPQVTKGHMERATDVAFSPVHNHLATASADRTARLWNTDGSLLMKFEGHLDRLARVAFHPSGKYLGTTSFDKTWRLWDIDSGVELLLQEGHSRSIYGIAFHHDGSLAASCGLDALARVWDLRTGRSIMALEGHVKPLLGISFSPNGYHLATGGEDNTCRIWDLRKKKSLYVIPAHSNLVSQVKFEPQEGYYLVTSSYDMTAKVWSGRDFKHVKTLSAHEAKVTSLDISAVFPLLSLERKRTSTPVSPEL